MARHLVLSLSLFLSLLAPTLPLAAASSSSSSSTTPSSPYPSPTLAGPPLANWPPAAATALDALIAANAHSGRYAVFDMDNTSYRHDLEESLLPFLENAGVLTRDRLHPSLRLAPFLDGPRHNESLYSYYLRLCAVDDAVCYPFAAQVFSGIPLRDLKTYVDRLMALNNGTGTGVVPTTRTYANGTVVHVNVPAPRLFAGMLQLYNRLAANGIDVYVVSASSEELVRMVAADPDRYGYNVPPANVIGVTLALRRPGDPSVLTAARRQIADGGYDPGANLDLVLSPFLWAPATWKTGKWAAILSYISMWRKPILVAGDTPSSDGPMLFHGVDVGRGGLRVWVDKKDEDQRAIDAMKTEFAQAQAEEGLPVTADKNWITVKPEEIL